MDLNKAIDIYSKYSYVKKCNERIEFIKEIINNGELKSEPFHCVLKISNNKNDFNIPVYKEEIEPILKTHMVAMEAIIDGKILEIENL